MKEAEQLSLLRVFRSSCICSRFCVCTWGQGVYVAYCDTGGDYTGSLKDHTNRSTRCFSVQIVPLDMGWESHHFVDEELGPQQATTAESPPTPLTVLMLTRSISERGKNVATGYA